MCVSAAVIAGVALLGSAVSAVSTISSANADQANREFANQLKEKQLRERRQLEELSAIETENARRDEFSQTRSAALAALGASGVSENISFFQAVDPEQQAALARDVRNVRLGFVSESSSIADQIRVGAYDTVIGGYNTKMKKVGAVGDFVQSAASAANFYETNKTPSKPKPKTR
jgi:hypothetical protein